MIKKRNLFLATLLCLAFLLNASYISAKEDRNLFSKRGDKNAFKTEEDEAIEVKDPSLINLAPEIGTNKEQFVADSNLFIVHIQDAHCNYEAQMNIAKIIEKLVTEYNLKLACVEGSSGIIDTTPFASFPDQKIRHEVADYFVRKGKITGPEYLSITQKLPLSLYGVETERYYNDNYRFFLKAIKFKDFARKYCDQIRLTLEKLKLKIFTPELIEIDNKNTLYLDKQIDFLEYSALIEIWAKKHKIDCMQYKNFLNQITIKKIEKDLDLDIVNTERENLLKEIISKKGKSAAKDIISKSLEFKLQKISSIEYYEYLLEAMKQHMVNKKNYANLINYVNYIKLFKNINASVLFKEIAKITEDIKEKLYTNDTQKELNNRLKNIRILNNLFTLEVPKSEYLIYKTKKDSFKTDYFLNFIKDLAPQYNLPLNFNKEITEIDKRIHIIESFYDVAIKRDEILIKNMLSKMQKDNNNFTVLITGGFHTTGITELLREKKISFIVIAPTISKKETNNPYVSVMLEQQNYIRGY